MESSKESNIIQAYEELHREYFDLISSRQYNIGTKICNFIDSIKEGKIISNFKQELLYRKMAKYAHKLPLSDFDYGVYPTPRPKIAVYTCITGGYDDIEIPKLFFDNIDYILYTDNQTLDSVSGWIVRKLPQEAFQYNDNATRNRFCKMHPNIVGTEYDFAIYIDGNICVYSDLTNMVNMVNEKTGLAFHRHNPRICIYDEVEACKIVKRGNIKLLEEQIKDYSKQGMPREYGLLEATIILSDLKNETSLHILDEWWKEYLKSGSKRDQIALPYVLWKLGYLIDDVGNLGYALNRNPKFRKVKHLK